MTNMLKLQPSVVDREGEALWYALFALRQMTAKMRFKSTGQSTTHMETLRQQRQRHSEILQGFFCEMGRSMPSQAR